MAISSSGAIRLAGDIGVELGNSNATTSTSLRLASDGDIDTINQSSASFPDGSTPHSMSEWYSYDHSASSFSVTSNLVFRIDPSDTSCYSGSGTTVNDLGSFGLTGTLYNGTSWNSSGYFTFDGSNDILQFPNGTNLIVPSSESQKNLETYFWMRPHTVSSNMIVVSTDDQSSSRRTFQIKFKSNGTFGPVFYYTSSSNQNSFRSHTMTANNWYLFRYQHRYVSGSYGRVELWHRKYNASSWTNIGDASKRNFNSYPSDICIGGQELENTSTSVTNPFNGDVGDVLMYQDVHSTNSSSLTEANSIFDDTKAKYGG